MFLPDSVKKCIERLESAGYRGYVVGGCVRDALLGLSPKDYDLCTDALPEKIGEIFSDCTQNRSGEKHGTVGVSFLGDYLEITTFRTEGGYADGRHPDWVRFVPSIEQDLSRRDFTVNAMAYHPETGYVDPFGGREDLKNRVLRTVNDPKERFREDALRILRGVRFGVTYRLTPQESTRKAMSELAHTMDKLARERVFAELCKLLPAVTAADLLEYEDILTQVIPELKPLVGFDQRSPHHKYDIYTHTAYVVQAVSADLALRWAALLHDTGKPASFYLDETGRGHFPGHAKAGAMIAEQVLTRLKAPTALRRQVVLLVEKHMVPFSEEKYLLRRRLGKYGEQCVGQLLQLQEADYCSKGVTGEPANFSRIREVLEEIAREDACLTVQDLKVTGTDLLEAGFAPGPELGRCLKELLELVQSDRLPNEKEALLEHIRRSGKEE